MDDPIHPVVDGVIQLPWGSMSTFLLEMRRDERTLARGTCLTVSHGGRWFLVTNRHNVTGRNQYTDQPINRHGAVPDRLLLCLPTPDLGNRWWGHAVALYDEDDRPLWSEHPGLGVAVDVVALPFERPAEARCFGLMLDDHYDFPVAVGEPLHVVGYRDGEPLFSAFPQWIETGLRTDTSDDWNGLPAFLVEGRLAPGSSGSPVFAYRTDTDGLRRSDGGPVGSDWASRFMGVYSGRTREGFGVVWNLGAVRAVVEAALLRGSG